MSLKNHPHIRATQSCPICGKYKSVGLVTCWPCYVENDLRNGNAEAEALLDRKELELAEQKKTAIH